MIGLAVVVANIACMVLVGHLAQRRGRSVKAWVWTSAFIGPFAIPMLYVLSGNHRGVADHA
jgi:hypothetical protein